MKPRIRHWRRRLVWLLAFCVLVSATYFGRARLLPHVASFLDVSEPPGAVDYTMVLGGGSDTRPFVAAALFRRGLTAQILVPRGKEHSEAEMRVVPSDYELIKGVLRARGVPEQAIVALRGEVSNTADEALALAEFLDRHPQKSVAVVTTSLHTRRARWIFHKVLGNRAGLVRFVAAPTDEFREQDWWRFESGWRTCSKEYAKLCFYWICY